MMMAGREGNRVTSRTFRRRGHDHQADLTLAPTRQVLAQITRKQHRRRSGLLHSAACSSRPVEPEIVKLGVRSCVRDS